MRALPLLLVLTELACGASHTNVSPVRRETEILDVQRAWDAAEVRRDVAALEAILDERFVFTYGSETPVDRATVMKNILANDNPSPSTPSEQRVVVNDDVAVATGVDTVVKVVAGRRVEQAYRHTTTFVLRAGRWRALAVHMVPVPVRHESTADTGS